MKLIEAKRAVESETFEPQIIMTISVPVETYMDMHTERNNADLMKIYGEGLLELLEEAVAKLRS